MRERSDKTMTAVRAAPYDATGLAATRPQSLWRNFWRRFCRHRLALVGVTVLMVLALSTLLGPLMYHHRINDIDFAVSLQGPSLAHPLGTDDLGQDLLARILYGGRVFLGGGLVAGVLPLILWDGLWGTARGCGGGGGVLLFRRAALFFLLPPPPPPL